MIFFSTCLTGQELLLKIEGKDSSETLLIYQKGFKKNHSSINSIEEEIQILSRNLQKSGFINLKTSALQQVKDSVFLSDFSLGEKISTIKIFYNPEEIPVEKLRQSGLKLQNGFFILPFEQTEHRLQQINKIIADEGRPFSTLKLEKIKFPQSEELEAHLKISHSGYRTIDSLVIRGYENFPKAYIKNFIRIKKGQSFNKSELDKKVELLKNLSFVKVPRSPEVLFTEDQTVLYLYLDKQNSNRFEGFLGFSTDDESGKFQLEGDLSLHLNNNLNYGESLDILYKNTASDQQHFKAQAKLPYLFSSPLGLKLSLDLFKQDSSYTTTEQTAALTYQLHPKWELESGYQFVSSNNLLKNDYFGGTSLEDFQSNFITAGLSFTDKNPLQPLFPIRTHFNLNIGYGKRKREMEDSKQQRLEFSGQHVFELDFRNNIFIGNHTSFLFSDTYLSNELFRFGGMYSVRGFEENSLRASFFSGIQTEYRFLLSANLYAHSIIDFAHLKNDVNESKNNLYGIGFGLGLETKAGLLKLAFANGKTDSESFKFEHTKVHISLSAVF